MSNTYQSSPFGIAQHPWLTKADTKYNDAGVFKLGLVLGGEDAVKFAEKVDLAAAAALERYLETDEAKKLKAFERKAFKTYKPYVVERDDEGNPTGYIVFRFKQNAKIKLKDGTLKDVKIAVLDASGKKEVTRPVFGGSELRVQFTFRDIVMKKDQQVGVQLAFGRVQVKQLADSNAGGGGFDAVEGYEETGEDHSSGPGNSEKPGNVDGDY